MISKAGRIEVFRVRENTKVIIKDLMRKGKIRSREPKWIFE